MRTLTANQTRVLALPFYQCCIRVKVDRGDGTMVDMTSFLGFNWVKTVKWGEDINDHCGSFTITFTRERYLQSLSPYVVASQANNQTGSFLSMLAVGRAIEIDTAVIPYDAEPASTDWIVSFQGIIDTLDPGKTDYEVEADGRDLGGKVADRVAESSVVGNPVSVALETSIQNDVLNQFWAPGGDTPPNLFTPSSPGWLLNSPYVMQPGQSALDQLSQMAEQIGWDVRYRWDNGTSSFRLTLWQPNRSPGGPDETFQPAQVTSASQAEADLSWVRNVVTVSYGNTSPPAGVVGGGAYPNPFAAITVTSSASIAKYGRRFCAIGLGQSSNIIDSTHANSLANAVLADLEDPIFTLQVDLLFRPEVMLGDYYAFNAPTPWWDQAQSLGVQAIAHEFDLPGDDGKGARAFTTLTCSGFPSCSPLDWTQAMSSMGAPPVKNNAPAAQAVTGQADVRGLTLNAALPVLNVTDWHETQCHLSGSSGFTPSNATLIDRGRKMAFKCT